MNDATLPAVTAATAAIVAATLSSALTYFLTKKREHEADWRKLKLERYAEYIAALSGVVQGRDVTPTAQARYADAGNGLTLVAPSAVLSSLYAFRNEISHANTQRTNAQHDALFNQLINCLRQDIHPDLGESKQKIAIHLLSVPPRQ